jgi:hypothetical protein
MRERLQLFAAVNVGKTSNVNTADESETTTSMSDVRSSDGKKSEPPGELSDERERERARETRRRCSELLQW